MGIIDWLKDVYFGKNEKNQLHKEKLISKASQNIENDNGKNALYYDNGQLKVEGNKKDGKENGYWKSYYENGKLEMEGNMQDDVKVGSWKFYYENGQLRSETTLDNNGKRHGKGREWYENGSIFRDQNLKHGVPNGVMLEYFENGNIRQEYNFKDGEMHGKNNQFYEDGNKDIIGNWKDGKKHGLQEQYYPSGNLETRTTYVDGLIEGVHIYLKEDGEVIEEKIMQKGLDITSELMGLMLQNDCEHMLKSGLIKDGPQEFEPGESSQNIYEYYISNNLRVESAEVSALNQLYKEGKIDKEYYDINMAGLGQIKKNDEWYASRGIERE